MTSLAEQSAKLHALETELARLAVAHMVPVMLAVLRALIEMVCQTQGQHFAVLYKIRFHEAVLKLLREKGIS